MIFKPKSKKITPIHFLPKFCSQCGSMLRKKFIVEEHCKRLRCVRCGFIAYLNPQPVAGAIPILKDESSRRGDPPVKNGKIFLLRRGIEPAKSTWTFPAGFVELGESVRDAAIRETKEEIGIKIVPKEVLGVYSYSNAGVVTVVYLADVIGGSPRISNEAEEVKEFTIETIPWGELSFQSTRDALKDWIKINRRMISKGRLTRRH